MNEIFLSVKNVNGPSLLAQRGAKITRSIFTTNPLRGAHIDYGRKLNVLRLRNRTEFCVITRLVKELPTTSSNDAQCLLCHDDPIHRRV